MSLLKTIGIGLAPNAHLPLDRIEMERVTTTTGPTPNVDLPGPPVPPPGNKIGDTFQTTACSGHTQESWTYVYDDNDRPGSDGWTLTDFVFHVNSPQCGKPGAGSGQ